VARLLYSALCSLDGYTVDAAGRFDWAAPSEEVHAFVNDRERPVGTYLYGRRMFDVMTYWAGDDPDADRSPVSAEYRGIWQAADKVVYSASLPSVGTPRTRLERTFDVEAVRRLKEAATADLAIGGATIAASALRAGLVDEVSLYLNPVAVGGGTPALPRDLRTDLTLAEHHVFDDGVVFVRYAVT
jgi:dihydrofolate reductase